MHTHSSINTLSSDYFELLWSLTAEQRGNTTKCYRASIQHATLTNKHPAASTESATSAYKDARSMRTKLSYFSAMAVYLLVLVERRKVSRYPICCANTPSDRSVRTASQHHRCTPSVHPQCNGWSYHCVLGGLHQRAMVGIH